MFPTCFHSDASLAPGPLPGCADVFDQLSEPIKYHLPEDSVKNIFGFGRISNAAPEPGRQSEPDVYLEALS